MKLLSTLLALTFLVGCSDGQKQKIEELETALKSQEQMLLALQERELLAQKQMEELAENVRNNLDKQLAEELVTGGGRMFIEEYASGSPKHRGYIKGQNVRTGEWVYWWENGQRQAEGRYVDHLEEGLWVGWHENGQKAFEGSFKNGEKEGLWTRWDENGQKESEGSYKNGEKEGLWTEWFETGHIRSKLSGIYKAGEKVAPLPDGPDQ